MVKITLENPIYDKIENVIILDKHRTYMGFSSIGHRCKRFIWYSFRWAYQKQHPLRVKRLFERGEWEEQRVIDDMSKANIIVFDRQLELEGHFGHAKGHIDGKAKNIPTAEKTIHLLEIKTANDKNFKQIEKLGVKRAKPEYYAQVQLYMGHSGLKRTLFICTNKNDEKRYYERIRFDQDKFDELEHIILDILMTDVPPPQIGDHLYWECKICSAYNICHLNENIERNCRTCKEGTIVPYDWECGRDNTKLTEDKQRQGCSYWSKLDTL